VPEIVGHTNCFDQVFVQAQRTGDRPRDLGDFEGMGESGSHVVTGRRQEDLRLGFQSPERPAVDDPVAVALEGVPDLGRRLVPLPRCILRSRRRRCEPRFDECFVLFARCRQGGTPIRLGNDTPAKCTYT